MENNSNNPSDSLMSVSDESLSMSEPDSPQSSCHSSSRKVSGKCHLMRMIQIIRASNPKGPLSLLSLFLDQVKFYTSTSLDIFKFPYYSIS